MSQSLVLAGAHIKLYINNTVYKEVQSISLVIDYGEAEIYGIDCPYPQEIAGTKISVKGNVSGIRVKNSGGLQSKSIRPLFTDLAASPYISIRIQDRDTKEDILYIPNAKVGRESHSAATKSSYKLSFDFAGQIPFSSVDRS